MEWIYISSNTGFLQDVMWIHAPTGGTTSYIFHGTLSDLTHYFESSSGPNISGTTLSTGTWYHITITKAQDGTVTLWLNGASDGTANDGGSFTPDRFRMGNSPGASRHLDGRIAAHKEWSVELTQAEIQQEMRQFLPVRTANLTVFSPFLDAGDTVDYSQNTAWTVDGTLTTEGNPPIPWKVGHYHQSLIIALTIATQTITGVARITATTLRTVTGVARITATTLRTVTGVARITRVISRTLAGVARITAAVARTISGTARITATALKTINGLSRITATTLRTISGVANIDNPNSPVYAKNAALYMLITKELSIMLGKPRLATWNTNGRPASPITGEVGFNTTTSKIEVYNGSDWVAVALA